MLDYQQLLDVGLSPDAETLQARLVGAAASLGFGLSSGTHIRGRLSSGKASVHAVFNTPEAFLDASRSTQFGLQDPFLTAVLAAPGCHSYSERLYRQAGADALWDLISAFGYRHGMAVALHEPSHAELFSFGIDGPDPLPTNPMHRLELEADLTFVAMHAQEAAKRLWAPAPAADLNILEREEVAALEWARDGVSVWSTGGKLVFSNPGLAQRQRIAARKLGAKNGPAAVLRAITGGLIEG